jgi:hypothetical protein
LYRAELGTQIISLMSEGRSLDGCASKLGVHPDTIYEWQRRYPEFSDAVRVGRAAAIAYWEDRLISVAEGKPGNAQLIQWALRNRSRAAAGWDHAHRKVEISGPDGDAIALKTNSTVIDASLLTKEQREGLRQILRALKPTD